MCMDIVDSSESMEGSSDSVLENGGFRMEEIVYLYK